MNMNRNLIAIMLAGLITSCGSSDDDSGVGGGSVTPTYNVQVIDGYLIGAEVYADRNNNNIAEPNEQISGLTSGMGTIALPETDNTFTLIARAVAGQTADTDDPGFLTTTFEFAAPAGSTVINPYTTLAILQNNTMAEIAAQLNLDEALITGDYIAAKSGTNVVDAQKAHLIARSLTLSFSNNITDSIANLTAIQSELAVILQQVTVAENNGENLDDIIIQNGQITVTSQKIQTLLAGNTYDKVAFNTATYNTDKVEQLQFAVAETTITSNNGEAATYPIEYINNGFQAVSAQDNIKETIAFIADNFFLTFGAQGGLSLLADTSFGLFPTGQYPLQQINISQFQGQTLYFLRDGSATTSANPVLFQFIFEESQVVISSYRNNNFEQISNNWSYQIVDNALSISLDITSFQWYFTTLTQGNLSIAYDQNNALYIFMTNQDAAIALYQEWVSNSSADQNATSPFEPFE